MSGREFEQSLQKMIAGDITLVNDLGGMRLAIQGLVQEEGGEDMERTGTA